MYELTSVELWRLIIAMFLGGIIIGYLLTSWHQDVLLDRAERKLAECSDEIDDLVASNDAADSVIAELRTANEFMSEQLFAVTNRAEQAEALLQLVPEGH